MTPIDKELPQPGIEVLALFSGGNYGVVSYHPELPVEQWWPGVVYFGEYGHEACVCQDVVAWMALP